jgi:thioredoxin-dependent peroxiredoxin
MEESPKPKDSTQHRVVAISLLCKFPTKNAIFELFPFLVSKILENNMTTLPYAAPVITGSDSSQESLKAGTFAGKWIVLYFYPKDMTSGCTVQAQDFQTHAEKFLKLGAIVIGVSKDNCASHGKFEQKEGLRFLLLSDEKGDLCERYGVWTEKSMYGRKYMGIERSTFIINPKNQVVKEWRKVKVPGHVAEVLETLKSLV